MNNVNNIATLEISQNNHWYTLVWNIFQSFRFFNPTQSLYALSTLCHKIINECYAWRGIYPTGYEMSIQTHYHIFFTDINKMWTFWLPLLWWKQTVHFLDPRPKAGESYKFSSIHPLRDFSQNWLIIFFWNFGLS